MPQKNGLLGGGGRAEYVVVIAIYTQAAIISREPIYLVHLYLPGRLFGHAAVCFSQCHRAKRRHLLLYQGPACNGSTPHALLNGQHA